MAHLQWNFQLNMVIFHSYVKLTRGYHVLPFSIIFYHVLPFYIVLICVLSFFIMFYWFMVYLPLWKIWRSIGMMRFLIDGKMFKSTSQVYHFLPFSVCSIQFSSIFYHLMKGCDMWNKRSKMLLGRSGFQTFSPSFLSVPILVHAIAVIPK